LHEEQLHLLSYQPKGVLFALKTAALHYRSIQQYKMPQSHEVQAERRHNFVILQKDVMSKKKDLYPGEIA